MPLVTIKHLTPECQLGIWNITEGIAELSDQCNHLINEEWRSLTTDRRRVEWLASRLLLEKLMLESSMTFVGLEKDENSKPFLKNSQVHVSISHTKEMAVACLHPLQRVGVDVEYHSPRVARIANKFLSQEEKEQTSSDWGMMLKYWCAKEALYKLQGKKGVIFKEDLLVKASDDKGIYQGQIQTKSESITAKVWVEEYLGHTIVCAIEQ